MKSDKWRFRVAVFLSAHTACHVCALRAPADDQDGLIAVSSIDTHTAKGMVQADGQLNIGELIYTHGIQCTGESNLVFRVPHGCKRFEAWAGRDMVTPDARLRFRVFTDDDLAFDSGWVDYHGRRNRPSVNPERAMRVSVPLQDVQELHLVTNGTGRANWAEAVFVPRGRSLWADPQSPYDETLAAAPPMGWNSWNCFGHKITARIYQEIVDTVVTCGMKEVGYRYVNLDDLGDPESVPERFPDGLKPLADYAHGKGLKFGMYAQGELRLDQGIPDASRLANIGVDYLKYDYSTRRQNRELAAGIRVIGRPIVLGTSEWGKNRGWEWAAGIGAQLWRTSFDLVDKWDSHLDTNLGGLGVLKAVDQVEALGRFAGPGHWNDPDMLIVGLHGSNHSGNGCTCAEYRSHFTLWCILAAPLLAGNDLRNMDAECRNTLLNREAIAVNQDPLGVQGWRCRKLGTKEVWIKPLQGNDLAVALLNRDEQQAAIQVRWLDLDIEGPQSVRDLWAHANLGVFHSQITFDIPPHETVFLRVSPVEAK